MTSWSTDPFGNRITIGVINNISLTLPPVSLLTQTNDIDESIFCNETSLPARCKGKIVCHCTHRLKVKLNSIVEIVIIDGFQLLVMGVGILADNPTTITNVRVGKMIPAKDTISIPSKGYTIFRFRADNPGFWLLHCHFGESKLMYFSKMSLWVLLGEKMTSNFQNTTSPMAWVWFYRSANTTRWWSRQVDSQNATTLCQTSMPVY